MRLGRAPLDWDYTHGTRLSVNLNEAPGLADALLGCENANCSSSITLGQEIYTPRGRGLAAVEDERPFAGWLYLEGSATKEMKWITQRLSAGLGVVGPPALAEQVQNGLHRLFASTQLPGWDTQLPTEPGIEASYTLQGNFGRAFSDATHLEINPSAAIGLGNIWSGMRSGGAATFRADWFYAFAGAQGEWVWRNEFLDGTLFRSSQSTPKHALVGQFNYGIGVRLWRLDASVNFIERTKEYPSQTRAHLFGSIALTYYPD